jgi:hypothetical protein
MKAPTATIPPDVLKLILGLGVLLAGEITKEELQAMCRKQQFATACGLTEEAALEAVCWLRFQYHLCELAARWPKEEFSKEIIETMRTIEFLQRVASEPPPTRAC